MTLDDSLLLSYDRKRGKPKGTDHAALSPSQAKRFKEDPHIFYLKKIEGLDEPFSMPLALGIAVHEAMEEFLRHRYMNKNGLEGSIEETAEVFRSELKDAWDKLPEDEKTVRVNPDDPTNPRDRETFEVTLERQTNKLLWLIDGLCRSIDHIDYNIFKAQRNPHALEESVGTLAKERDLPHDTIESYDPHVGEYGDINVSLIAGVPVRGRADCIGQWPDGSLGIIDHKCVTKVIAFYPNFRGGRVSYDPSYDPATDLQLDLYSAASGIPRAGFQFMLRQPQYLPDDNVLRDGWIEESEFKGNGFPTALVSRADGLRYVGIYRPTEEDGADPAWRLPGVRHRAGSRLRDIAERMTESMLLHQDGVEPEIAFPAGDPEEIAKKACPYCHFNDTDDCRNPREANAESREQYRKQITKREEIASSLSPIQERREHWENLRNEHNLPSRSKWVDQIDI